MNLKFPNFKLLEPRHIQLLNPLLTEPKSKLYKNMVGMLEKLISKSFWKVNIELPELQICKFFKFPNPISSMFGFAPITSFS